jgi:glycogen phosphorylase
LFLSVFNSLLHQGATSDHYLILADFRSYIAAQEAVNRLYLDPEEWTKRSILNTARMGKFSSDRAVLEYAADIWKVQPFL